VVLAVEVDHIVPIREGGARLDANNLQPLCHTCHSRKTMLEYLARG
jgi:5-methylcytosine-specific restriction protein A